MGRTPKPAYSNRGRLIAPPRRSDHAGLAARGRSSMRPVAPRSTTAPSVPRDRPPAAVHTPRATAAQLLPIIVPLAILAAVWALYSEALGYAFMYDDGIDLARGEHRSVLSLLTS